MARRTRGAKRWCGLRRANSPRSIRSEGAVVSERTSRTMTDIFAGEPTPHDAGGLPDALPLLPLRETVLFPHAILPLAAGRPASLRLIEEAARGNRRIGVVTQRDATAEEPQAADL